MDSSPIDPTIYDPTSLQYPTDPSLSGGTGTNGSGGAVPDFQQILAGIIPGASAITELISIIGTVVGDIKGGIQWAQSGHPIKVLQNLSIWAKHADKVFISEQFDAWQWITNLTVGTLFTGMLEYGLGVDVTQFDENAKKGVDTTDTIVGFALVLPYICNLINAAGSALLAERWPETIGDAIRELPEEMGFSWALGLQIDEAYKTAVGASLEEGINRQKRGSRIEWPQLRVLLKQHILSDEQYVDLLKNAGFPDEQIEWLRKLQDVLLPVGDLQQLYLRDEMTADDVLKYLGKLGFGEEDAKHVMSLYIDKAETEASALYRSTARTLFTNQLISEDQYRKVLDHANYPKREADDDVAAINLLHQVGRVQTSAAVIKTRYQHHQISAEEAIRELQLLNYSPDAITNLIQTWNEQPLTKQHGLSQAKVLSYLVSGVLTRDQAYQRLLEMGVNGGDAQLLVDHPTASNGTHQFHLTPALVTQAYLDGAISQAELGPAFKAAGIPTSYLPWMEQQATWKFSHKRGNPGYTATLTLGDIKAAFKYGLMDLSTCLERLGSLGYDSHDAMILMEVENKGVFQPPQPPLFANLGEAIAFLQSQGYGIHSPPDPRIGAAETMLVTAGYTYTLPAPGPAGGVLGTGEGVQLPGTLGTGTQTGEGTVTTP